jgi:hypothetical protein
MSNLWGSTFTYSQLAGKYGWLSVIVSAVLLPLLVCYNWVLAYNPLLQWCGITRTVRWKYTWPKELGSDFLKDRLYSTPTNEAGICSFVLLAPDSEKQKWHEAAWGALTVLDMKIHSDKLWELKSNWLSMPRAHVSIDFLPDGQIVTFDLFIGISPFSWLSWLWIVSALRLYVSGMNARFLKMHGGHFRAIGQEELPDGVPNVSPGERFATKPMGDGV